MEEIKTIIANNIADLRRKSGMTQTQLAEKLNYSDKAVSKWERAESVPDIAVLKAIADTFGVTVDYLITSEHEDIAMQEVAKDPHEESKRLRKHWVIAGMSMLLVWLVAAIIFVPVDIAVPGARAHWLAFVFAVPVTMLVWLIFNAMWFNRRRNYLIISLMCWTLIAAIHITVLAFGHNIWQMYLIGIPGQLIIILWSRIGKKPHIKSDN